MRVKYVNSAGAAGWARKGEANEGIIKSVVCARWVAGENTVSFSPKPLLPPHFHPCSRECVAVHAEGKQCVRGQEKQPVMCVEKMMARHLSIAGWSHLAPPYSARPD